MASEKKYFWKISWYLDKGKKPYFPYEKGIVESIEIENTSNTRYHIYEIGIQFDWQEGSYWYRNCSVEIDAKQKGTLPNLAFRVPVDVKTGSHTYKTGISYEVLVNSQWKNLGLVWIDESPHILIDKSPSRNFKVFISHSNVKEDKRIVDTTQKLLEACGIDAYVAEKRAEPGVRLWSKLEKEIRKSDALLVIWTKHGAASGDVREEIGIAVGAKKYEKIVPIAEVDLEGSLKGKEYASLERENPQKAIAEAVESILKMAEKKRPVKSRVKKE